MGLSMLRDSQEESAYRPGRDLQSVGPRWWRGSTLTKRTLSCKEDNTGLHELILILGPALIQNQGMLARLVILLEVTVNGMMMMMDILP